MLQPIVYLTCELKGRDLASRLLIASRLVQGGYTVIVGQQWSIFSNVRACPKGVILFKTANKNQAEWMSQGRQHGHVVVASDEECLASAPGDYARLTQPEAMDSCHTYLAINELHAAAIKAAYPSAADKVQVAGSARIDILRTATPPRRLAEPYILINTSFGRANHVSGDVQTAVGLWLGAGGHEPDAQTMQMVNDRLSFEKRALAETLDLIDWLVVNTTVRIVVRPHPAERPETWSERAKGNPRILVVPSSDPGPWMKHALVVIHSESTTGVEAAIMGVRALNLSPPSPWRDRLIVADANVTVSSAAEAAEAIMKLFREGQWPSPKVDATALFPKDGAGTAAKAIAKHLPDPRSGGGRFDWHKIVRTDAQRAKFSVTAREVAAQVTCKSAEIDDSVFILMP